MPVTPGRMAGIYSLSALPSNERELSSPALSNVAARRRFQRRDQIVSECDFGRIGGREHSYQCPGWVSRRVSSGKVHRAAWGISPGARSPSLKAAGSCLFWRSLVPRLYADRWPGSLWVWRRGPATGPWPAGVRAGELVYACLLINGNSVKRLKHYVNREPAGWTIQGLIEAGMSVTGGAAWTVIDTKSSIYRRCATASAPMLPPWSGISGRR